MCIGALVRANERKEAEALACKIFEDLTENNTPFDYYSLLADETRRYDTLAGDAMVEQFFHATVDEFERSMKYIRKAIRSGLSDEQLMEDDEIRFSEEPGWMFRYWCLKVGEYRGPNVWLYDGDGEGIRDRNHLKNVIEDWKCLGSKHVSKADIPLWIVVADVHY